MTRLHPTRPLRRQTDTRYHGEHLIIELFPTFLRLRTKGSRQHYDLTYAAAYECGGKIAARAERGVR